MDGQLVHIGPFRRIKEIYWPHDDSYIFYQIAFSRRTFFDTQPGDFPTGTWSPGMSVNSSFIYAEDIYARPIAASLDAFTGFPTIGSVDFEHFAWVASDRHYGGSGYPNDFYLYKELTGDPVFSGPRFDGELAKNDTTLTIQIYHTPYFDIPKWYPDLGALPGEGPVFFRQFYGMPHAVPSFGNVILAAEVAFDFSATTVIRGSNTYQAAGLHWVRKSSAFFDGADIRDAYDPILLLRRLA